VFVKYLRDDTDDVAPRLWRKFTDVCNVNSYMMTAVTNRTKIRRTLSIVSDLASDRVVIS
jgi:hypothetical protein